MPLGHRFTPTEDSVAKGISLEYQKKGYTKKDADRIGYATVVQMNKDKKLKRDVDNSVANKIRNR